MNLDRLSQQEVSRLLGVSARQVRRLEDEHGLPRREDGAYRWSDVRDFYLRFKVEEGLDRRAANLGEDYEAARARREVARARQAELDLERREDKLISRAESDDKYGGALDLVRRSLLAAPGRWGAQLGFDNPRQGQQVMEEIVREILEHLSGPVADAVEIGRDSAGLPEGFPARGQLESAGIETLVQVRTLVEDGELRSLRGIGDTRERKIREALEREGLG